MDPNRNPVTITQLFRALETACQLLDHCPDHDFTAAQRTTIVNLNHLRKRAYMQLDAELIDRNNEQMTKQINRP